MQTGQIIIDSLSIQIIFWKQIEQLYLIECNLDVLVFYLNELIKTNAIGSFDKIYFVEEILRQRQRRFAILLKDALELRHLLNSCWLSHLKLLLEISQKNTSDIFLILEDDSVFVKKFLQKSQFILNNIESNWDILRVGFCSEFVNYLCENRRNIEFCKLRKDTTFTGTQAYFLNGSKSAKKIFDSLNNEHGLIIDMELKTNEYNQYTSTKKLVYQNQKFKSDLNNPPCV